MNLLLSFVNTLKENWMLFLMIGVLIAFFAFTIMKQKKEMNTRNELVSSIKKGTKIVTTAGVYGVVESIEETTDGKVAIISTGNSKNPTTMTIHINAIMGIDNKTLVKDGNKVSSKEIAEDVETEVEDDVETESEDKEKKTSKKKTSSK